jgi:hypothetical protein
VGSAAWDSSPPEARDALIADGQPVLLVERPLPGAADAVVTDGRAEFPAPLRELLAVDGPKVVVLARMFAHASASPSPRCASVDSAPPPPSPLSWLSPAGLRNAGQATFEVPGRALRHIIGRGGATIRRLEAGLGVLIGAVDGPGALASVSLCGPPERLADAELVLRLVGQGHRSLLGRLEEGPGAWAGSPEGDDGEAGGSRGE